VGDLVWSTSLFWVPFNAFVSVSKQCLKLWHWHCWSGNKNSILPVDRPRLWVTVDHWDCLPNKWRKTKPDWRCFTKHKPHAGHRKGRKCRFCPLPGYLDLWPWPSNLLERGTKHVFRVNLAQIRSAVPDIFNTQTKNTTDWRRQKQNLPQFSDTV